MKHYCSPQKGSVLLIALIFALVVAIALSSYVHMTTTTLKLSHRAFLATESTNVCEAGLEQALWSFNQAVTGNAAAWTGWTVKSSTERTRTFTTFALSQNATASVKVYVQNYNPPNTTTIPIIVAEATVTPVNGPTIRTKMKCELARRSLFGRGGVALNGFVFKGNGPMADSWNSRKNDDGSLRASPVPYIGAGLTGENRRDKVSLAAINVDAAVAGQNADIYGTVSIGASSNAGFVTVGPNGSVGPFGTALGTVDPNSVKYNFTMDVPPAANPTPSVTNTLGAINSSVTLPVAGDVAAADGKYYYSVPSITLNPSASLLAVTSGAEVVIMSSGDIKVGGSITVNTGATLALYTPADVTISGAIDNVDGSAYTGSMQIWGTKPSGTQDIKLSGNGTLSAVVYAPNGIIEVKGGGTVGDIYGSFVGNKVTFTGNDSFHWDESLSDMTAGGTFMPSKWRQLVSAADRELYNTELSSF